MFRDKLISELIRDEGERLSAYQDSLGYWTIGVGRLIDKRKGGGISPEESRFLLTNDILKVEADLDRDTPWWRGLSEIRQRVIANMRFNLGGGLNHFKNTLAAARDGRYADAAKGMLASKWAKQVGARANRLAFMMEHDRELVK